MRDKLEIYVSKELSGKLTKASGAVYDDADVRTHNYLIECKRITQDPFIVFKISVWNKLRKQAIKARKDPLYILQVRNEILVLTYFDLLVNKLPFSIVEIPIEKNAKSVTLNMLDYTHLYSEKKTVNIFVIFTTKIDNIKLGFTSFKDIKDYL